MPVPRTQTIASARPPQPRPLDADREADGEQHGRRDQRPQARRDDHPREQRRARSGGGEQAVEPALFDVARQVDPGRRAGEPGALEKADRDDEALVALRVEAAQLGQVPEHRRQPEEEDRRREHAGDRGARDPQDLVRGAADERADGGDVGGQPDRRVTPQPTLSRRLRATAASTVEIAPTSAIAPSAFASDSSVSEEITGSRIPSAMNESGL